MNDVGGSRNAKVWEMKVEDWDFALRPNLRPTYAIIVNAVAPGPIDTERFGLRLRKLNETVEYSPNHMTQMKRLGQPVEVAHAVLFLASDGAGYVTGSTLAVTGGR